MNNNDEKTRLKIRFHSIIGVLNKAGTVIVLVLYHIILHIVIYVRKNN